MSSSIDETEEKVDYAEEKGPEPTHVADEYDAEAVKVDVHSGLVRLFRGAAAAASGFSSDLHPAASLVSRSTTACSALSSSDTSSGSRSAPDVPSSHLLTTSPDPPACFLG
jgi:hypothetical protein